MSKPLALKREGDLRPEYDLSQLKGGVRGKYYKRAKAGTNLVLVEPDLMDAFPDAQSVNRALRLLLEVARQSSGGAGRQTGQARPTSHRRAARRVRSAK
jgi:hypothetical protein